MIRRLRRKHLLAALAALFVVALPGESLAQEISPTLEGEVLSVFQGSIKELQKSRDVRIRGHEIGGGKFKSCEGIVHDIGSYPLRNVDKCRESGRPNGVSVLSGEVVSLDAGASMLEIQDAAGARHRLFVPPSARLVNGGRLDKTQSPKLDVMSGKRIRVTVFSVIPERAEAIAFDDSWRRL